MKFASWLRSCAAIAFVCLAVLFIVPATAQTTTVSTTYLGGSVSPTVSGNIYWQPMQAISVMLGGARVGTSSGQIRGIPYVGSIATGVTSVVMPDSLLTNPNICYAVTAIDGNGNIIIGNGLQADGVHVNVGGVYGCVQPTGSTWSFDTYVPSTFPTILPANLFSAPIANTLSSGSPATVAIALVSGQYQLTFGIPTGPAGPAGLGSDAHCGADGSGHLTCITTNSTNDNTSALNATASVATPVVTVAGTPATPGSQSLATATPLQGFVTGSGGSLAGKMVVMSGDSTTAGAAGAITAFCSRTGPGQEMPGLQCFQPSTYSIDGSHNVTVNGPIPPNCVAGVYISFDASGTFQSNALNNTWSNSTFLIASASASSVTFNNPGSVGATGSTGTGTAAVTCSIINNGSNGQTQAGYNSGTGQGTAAFVVSENPDLDIHIMGINDGRGGAVSAAQLEVLYKAYFDNLRANSTKTEILFATPNSLLADDPSNSTWVTSSSTTSTTAVTSTGSQTITLAAALNSISGLITPDLTLAQEVANADGVTVAATTGSITTGTTSLAVASATGFTRGMAITVAGAGISGANLTTIIQSISGTTFTVAPQASTTVTSAAVAQSGTVYSAHLLVDTGANQEIVPITAIAGSTVTATFALTHSSGFTVIPTLATMAQAYTNILHDATMSFEGVYPNVQVVDTQSTVFGRLVPLSTATTYMTNQLHPASGYDARSAFFAGIVNKDRHFGGSKGAVVSPVSPPTFHFSSVSNYSPFLAQLAINNNYSACWTNGYYQCVEDPDYYTFIGGGVLAGAGTGYIRVQAEVDTLVPTGGVFGVIPCLIGDVVEIVGASVSVATSACGSFATYTALSVGGTPAVPTSGLPTAVRIYRPKFQNVAQEPYAKSPSLYPFHHTISAGAAGTNFFRFAYSDFGQSWGGAWTSADTIVFANGSVLPLSTVCSSFFFFAPNQVQCNGTGNWTAYAGLQGVIYGNHAIEIAAGAGSLVGSNFIATTNVATTNPLTKITNSITPAAATASSCVEQTFTYTGLVTTQQAAVSPPSSLGAHIWIGSSRVSAANTLAIDFCADATAGTPPSGNYVAVAF
jgi:hypothetical protein